MNNNEITNTLSAITNIESFDIDSHISNIFVNQDISTIRISHFAVPDYISVIKRLLKQLKNEIQENGIYLPFQYNYNNEFGGGNLQSDLINLFNNIKATSINNFNNSVSFINRLIYYQIANGFWDRSTRKIYSPNDVKSTELADKLNYIEEQLSLNTDKFKSLLENLQKERDSLQSFINQKNDELQTITNNLQASNNNSNQINQLLTASASTSEKINGILTQQQQNLENIVKELNSQKTSFNEQKNKFTELNEKQEYQIGEVEKQISDFTEKLTFVEDKKAYFEERNTYLDNLIGREVGASLFETFKQRKNELKEPVSNWNKIVICISILTFIAVLAIFTNGFGLWGDAKPLFSWQQVAINSLKTTPFFFLLFYSISQYNKERNFQEEYAFKSAVALTIKAYSDIIQKEELKDEMIVNSVTSIYKSPITQKTKLSKEENAILDTAKDLISTAIDTYKKK